MGSKVRVSDRSEVLATLKQIPKASNIKEATQLLGEFCQQWESKYPKLIKQMRNKQNLFSFMYFPKVIWASLYTNNLSESINKQLKRRTKTREQFPHDYSLEKTREDLLLLCFRVKHPI